MIVCETCGSKNVQVAMWVRPNTMEIVDDFGSWKEPDTKWCDKCEDHTSLKDTELEDEDDGSDGERDH